MQKQSINEPIKKIESWNLGYFIWYECFRFINWDNTKTKWMEKKNTCEIINIGLYNRS